MSCFVGGQKQLWGPSPSTVPNPRHPQVGRRPGLLSLGTSGFWPRAGRLPETPRPLNSPPRALRAHPEAGPTQRPAPPAGFTPALTPWAGGLPLVAA